MVAMAAGLSTPDTPNHAEAKRGEASDEGGGGIPRAARLARAGSSETVLGSVAMTASAAETDARTVERKVERPM